MAGKIEACIEGVCPHEELWVCRDVIAKAYKKAKRDSERLDWMDENPGHICGIVKGSSGPLRAALDSAMKHGKRGRGK